MNGTIPGDDSRLDLALTDASTWIWPKPRFWKIYGRDLKKAALCADLELSWIILGYDPLVIWTARQKNLGFSKLKEYAAKIWLVYVAGRPERRQWRMNLNVVFGQRRFCNWTVDKMIVGDELDTLPVCGPISKRLAGNLSGGGEAEVAEPLSLGIKVIEVLGNSDGNFCWCRS